MQKSPSSLPPLHPFSSPQLTSILSLSNKFTTQILSPIRVFQQLSYSHLPQKCLLHSNNLTLYCQNDHKPLCASCMYQSQLHKNHKVSPLASCETELLRDANKFQRQLQFVIGNLSGLVKYLNQGIAALQLQFPKLIGKVQNCYKSLHYFIADRQNETINQLKYYKQRMKYQHGVCSTQLNKIVLYMQQKIDQHNRKQGESRQSKSNLVKRNVFEVLKNTARLIGQELDIKQKDGEKEGKGAYKDPKVHFEIFREIQDFMLAKLPNIFSGDNSTRKDKDKNYRNNRTRTRQVKSITPSKSRQKISFSPVSNTSNNANKKNNNDNNPKSRSKSTSKSNLRNQKSDKKILSNRKTPGRQNQQRTPAKGTAQTKRIYQNRSPQRQNSPKKQSSSPGNRIFNKQSPKRRQQSPFKQSPKQGMRANSKQNERSSRSKQKSASKEKQGYTIAKKNGKTTGKFTSPRK